MKTNQIVTFGNDLEAKVIEVRNSERVINFNKQGQDLKEAVFKIGQMPLPPYIKNPTHKSFNEYQTIYAQKEGSIAAPTAGFHFTQDLIDKITNKGVNIEYLTLHVGLGTFMPVKTGDIENHVMHSEYYEINQDTATRLNQYKKEHKRIISVGTTSCRVLESCADEKGYLKPQKGWTDIFIYPGYKFKFIDALITNFHLPKSTLLMLVSAFASKDLILKAYQEAIGRHYRFYSFGDAMLIQ